MIVGAPNNDANGVNAGRAYIYFGGFPMDTTADVVLTGEAPWDRFGASVAFSGDVNGDGYGDVIIGAHGSGAPATGRAYIYFGGALMDTTADVILLGESVGDVFGASVSSAGDVNGDDTSDVIIGAGENDSNGNNAGRAYIYYGGASMDTTADVVITGETAWDWFGADVSWVGDVNGDDTSDVIVGAPASLGIGPGRSYIYFGGASMDTVPDVVLNGSITDSTFGNDVSSAGDVDGDSISDVLVGAPSAGRGYLYLGGVSMDTIPDVTLWGDPSNIYGRAVAPAGDVNGDGYSDVIVGAPLCNFYCGRAFVYKAKVTGIEEDNDKLKKVNVQLYQNEPNPFSSMSTIRYSIAQTSHTTLKIYNVAGQFVRTLEDEVKESGWHTINWDGRDDFGNEVANGTYYYELVVRGEKGEQHSKVNKMILMM
jgi:hypothetical protein